MKKTFFFLLAVLVFGLMSCDGNPVVATKNLPDVDLVVVHQGQMQFYNHAAQTLIPYEAEKDSVVNVVFDHNNHLYYTAAKQQDLTLKVIDLSEADPQPQLCAHWQLKLDQITDVMLGTGAFNLEIDDSMENLILMCSPLERTQSFDYETFNIVSGKTGGWSSEEYQSASISKPILDHYFDEQHRFYHVTPEGKVCLSEKIDFKAVFSDKQDLDALRFEPENLSSDGVKIVFSAQGAPHEMRGCYCVSTNDGQNQTILKDSYILNQVPEWLADGSLVYIGLEPRPKSDPAYKEFFNETIPSVRIVAPNGTTSVLATDAERFYLNPVGKPLNPVKENSSDLRESDMAIFDDGKVTFYNSLTNAFIPFVDEKDYVVSGVFVGHEVFHSIFYYTVSIGDELYLKQYNIGDCHTNPVMIADWNLKLSDCVFEGEVAPMSSYSNVPVIGMVYNYNEEFSEFLDKRYYNYNKLTIVDGRSEDLDVEGGADNKAMRLEEDKELFQQEDVVVEGADEDKSYYYYVQEGKRVCLSDKIDFDKYKSEYAYEPQFEFLGMSPLRDCVVYGAPLEWGHVGHGPLCFATLDGRVQKVLHYDYQEACYGWLDNGKLVYVSDDGIHMVSPDGTDQKISSASRLVTRY